MSSDRPRILIDALSVTSGGGYSYAVNLIRELDRHDRGFSFTFLVPMGGLAEIPTSRVRIRPVKLPEFHPALRLVARFLYEELVLPVHAIRYDAVYAIADLASPLLTVPTVVALRNLNIYDHDYDDTLRLRTLEKLVRLGVRRASRVIFPSHAAARLIGERLGLPSDVRRVVPHGVDAEAFSRVSKSEADPNFLFLPAAVDRHKNLEILVEAIPHFNDSRLEIRVAGSSAADPAYKAELLEKAHDLGVEDRFILLGPVPYEDVVDYYRRSLALVFPSFLETFGHPMLEAMLTGTPIVASEIPALRELGEGVALFFSPRDAVALAHAVDQLTAEPEATAARTTKGRERASSYSWKASTDTLCAVFRDVLSE